MQVEDRDIENIRKIIGRFLETRRSYGVAHLNDKEAKTLANFNEKYKGE